MCLCYLSCLNDASNVNLFAIVTLLMCVALWGLWNEKPNKNIAKKKTTTCLLIRDMSTFLNVTCKLYVYIYKKQSELEKNLTYLNPYAPCDIWQYLIIGKSHCYKPGYDINCCMLMLVLTGFWCWLASTSELMGCKNSSWGEMGLKATKPPRVLCWSRKRK